MKKYKLIIIGGGTAGLRAAMKASRQISTCLIEPGLLGGTCLNTGCIPTKAMLHASHMYRLSKSMKEFGVQAKLDFDIKQIMKKVHSIVEEGQEHIKEGIKKRKKLRLIEAKASFVNENTIKAGNHTLTADKIIICTGAKNYVPPIPGLKSYLDHASIMHIKKIPISIVMIGGGYISMEFATFFSNLGSQVIVLERLPEILTMVDDDLVQLLKEHYAERGIKILTNVNIIEVKGKKLVYNDVCNKNSKKNTIEAEEIFLATGRIPNTDGLNLKAAGIKTGKRGEIIVNKYLETTAKNVYAIGDVNGKALFAHAAKRQTKVVLDNVFNNKKRAMDFSLIPWAVYTNPPIAGVGEKATGVLTAKFTNLGRARIAEDQRGLVKVFYNKNKNITGATIIGPNADDIIHEFVALITMRATIDDLQNMIHVHPTFSEVMENLK